MTQIYNPCATKFGICIDHNTPFTPSSIGIFLLLSLHISACAAIWILDWSLFLCGLINIVILWFMVYSMDRYIFGIIAYRFRFFFEDKAGWVIQEAENSCYRATLKFAFCSRYLVILGLSKQEEFSAGRINRIKRFFCQKPYVLPIFFDSLPRHEFRQLRKVLIVLGYSV